MLISGFSRKEKKKMETSPKSRHSGVLLSITKMMRVRRKGSSGVVGTDACPDDDMVKFPVHLDSSSTSYQLNSEDQSGKRSLSREALASLVAALFASIAAVKASYAQMQIAQFPYEPEAIQSADVAVVSGLKIISQLKRCYYRKQFESEGVCRFEIQEQKDLIRTFKITTGKLNSDLMQRKTEITKLEERLQEAEEQNRCLDEKIDPARFLKLVRQGFKSIRNFVKLMVTEMEASGWDVTSAACFIQPDLVRAQSEHYIILGFQSFVCRVMFSGFQHRDFGITNSLFQFEVFWRTKYQQLVHPKMESSLFGDLNQRQIVSSGKDVPDTKFFHAYLQMARRIWILHRLFSSFGSSSETSIFEVRRGERFSEVYMQNVGSSEKLTTVSFTVMPGFKLGTTVVPCCCCHVHRS
ncbi:hypothetical protein ZOSMA_313G00240 [Zostera marina]|uniref:Uncharacterized protein n=1 Tax=Zostera marina TaxID=29655 RepID=A0A0K9P9N5_ZOSMR|nr:hypothetical protein ZOSMA_313G00240 [Zostera marina]